MQPDSRHQRVCVGKIVAAHGVRGLVKVKSYTAKPESLAAYGPVTLDGDGRPRTVHLMSPMGPLWLARLDGIDGRTAALAVRGRTLWVDRTALPRQEEADEFYHIDLIGLHALAPDGQAFGHVAAVYNHGAGDVLEVRRMDGKTTLVPFTRACVPDVRLRDGCLTVDPPAESF